MSGLAMSLMKYSTSELQMINKSGDRQVIVLYGTEDSYGETSFECKARPEVYGTSDYIWDEDTNTLTLSYVHLDENSYILIDNIQLVVLSKNRAAKTWAIEADNNKLTMISDLYLLRDYEYSNNSLAMEVEASAQGSGVDLLMLNKPKNLVVDGRVHPFVWNDQVRSLFIQPQRVKNT